MRSKYDYIVMFVLVFMVNWANRAQSLVKTEAVVPNTSTNTTAVKQGQEVDREKVDREETKEKIIESSQPISLNISLPKKSHSGLGFGASKVYFSKPGLSLGAYGEITYKNFSKTDQKNRDVSASTYADRTNLLRNAIYIGYRFDEQNLINSSVVVEGSHANLEFLYYERGFSKSLNWLTGLILPPLGLLNENHEPAFFQGVDRPLTETYILPSTWSSVGSGVTGEFSQFQYRAFVHSSLRSSGFTGSTAFQAGRQNGRNEIAENFGGTVRLDFVTDSLLVGVSGFVGPTGQTQSFIALTTISDLHFKITLNKLYLKGLVAFSTLGNAGDINSANFFFGSQSVGSQTAGAYLEIGYDIFNFFGFYQEMIAFIRAEAINTQFQVPDGFQKSGANEIQVGTVGIQYKPVINIAMKLDYQFYFTRLKSGVNRINAGLAYGF